MRHMLLAATMMASAGCSDSSNTPHATSTPTESHRLTVLYFDGCPNTPPTLSAARRAAATLGPAWSVVTIDLESLPESDIRRGYGSPTILLEDDDLFGAPVPASPTLNCRHYPDGAPSADSIVDAARRRAEPAREHRDAERPG